MRSSILFSLLAVATLGACNAHSIAVKRPSDPALDHTVTEMWADEIRAVAQDGDWILSRSYYFVGDLISLAPGEDLSHASIYSAKTGTVIEAVRPVVREIPLEQLIARNHYVILVRPSKMSAEERAAAVTRARGQLGVAFDSRGMFGLDDAEKWYCTELVYWASGVAARHHDRQTVVTPPEMLQFGQVIYWSGQRTDKQILRAAAAHVEADDGVAQRATARRLAHR
jgi:hypothetical protein